MLLDERQKEVLAVGWELPCEAIVDLQEDLNLWQMHVEIHPRPIYDTGYGGLGKPGKGFGKYPVNSIEDMPAITERILNKSVSFNSSFSTLMPPSNSRMRCEPYLLSAISFMGGDSNMAGNCSS